MWCSSSQESGPYDGSRAKVLCLRVCFGATLLGAKCCENVVASGGSNVVSSCGCEVVKKRSPKIASKHVVTRHGQSKKCHHRNDVGQILGEKKHGLFLFLLFILPSENGRRSVFSFTPPSSLQTMQNRNSGTTLLPHVVTSLQPRFRYFVARALQS